MKTILLSTLAFCVLNISQLFAQVSDSVSLSKLYTHQSFYSLSNGEILTSENTWDLAFGTGATGSTIRINGVTGIRLYVSPITGVKHWETLDTTNFSSWKVAYDSDTTWSIGAFSDGNDGNFNLGWGTYSMITHQVVGSKLFVIKLANGNLKKIWIEKLASGTYEFRHANLDGSNEIKSTISKTNYTTKNFVYYSIEDNKIIDREPISSSWDLVFTNYLGEVAPTTFYNVTGILANSTVQTSKAEKVNVITAISDESSFSTKINTIGYNWIQLEKI